MRLPAIQGIIDRRILVNYRVDPSVAAGLLPAPFRPKLVNGYAMAGICLIRLKQVRPAWMRCPLALVRRMPLIASRWNGIATDAARKASLFRAGTAAARLNALPRRAAACAGEHHHAHFEVDERNDGLHVKFQSG